MKKLLLKHWRKFLIIIFAAIVIITLVFNSMLIRSTTYEEGSQHLNELSAQIASSIEKQSRDQWNMLTVFYQYLINSSSDDWTDLDSYIKEKKEDLGFDSLCLVDEDAMYYDKGKSFSLLWSKEVTEKLLTNKQPIILDNMLSTEGSLIFLIPVEKRIVNGKKICALGGPLLKGKGSQPHPPFYLYAAGRKVRKARLLPVLQAVNLRKPLVPSHECVDLDVVD